MMRRASFTTGIVVLAVVWLGPLPSMAAEVFAAHMTMHMGVVAVAAPLLTLGIAGGAFDPVRVRPRWFHPIAASVLELIVVWAWHAPRLHHIARSTAAGLVLEQGLFLAVGLLVWMSAFGGDGGGRRAASGVVGLLLTAMHMTLLGALLALASRPIYHTEGAGLSALEDQHLGGAIMLLVGGVSYLAGGLGRTAGLLRRKTLDETA